MLRDERHHGLSRREFLRVGALSAGTLGLPLSERAAASPRERNCILLFLVGGPSQLDTWDLKPQAPAEIRGPFQPIQSSVVGLHVSECFPQLARRAERVALIRSLHHDAAPIHETGHQLMQTGRLCQPGLDYPHFGSALSHLHGPRGKAAPFVILPGPIGNTGVSVSHGQQAGFLGDRHEPVFERPSVRGATRYGLNPFGQACLRARQLVEQGTRLVTVNMFDSVFNELTWDCHADGGALGTNLDDYRDTLCPMFDVAYTALLDELEERGLLDTTLVVAMGEFGRTPKLNPRGGRDHWPGVWSILLAGGGVQGGQVIGSSNAIGSEPHDRPVTPAEVAASIYHALGVDLQTTLPGPDGQPVPLVDAQPIHELFA
ncbi:MAG: DUF1501 domain-containing protein [Gemmataceae bacterium]